MTESNNVHSAAKVSIILPTYNRRKTFGAALNSALHQNHSNIQVIVVNDGGQDVSDIVKSFNDERVLFIDRKQNRGKAYSLNEALSEAKGKYVSYLDDDDIWYPNHSSTLVNILENHDECGLAYGDLYRVKCKVDEDGNREILSKMVDVCRDFDRFFMLYFNHVLHVSLMHRRDLLEKTGLYNERLGVLIDWDMTRRMCFFTDFYHTTEIVGEYYSPIDGGGRISVEQRKNHQKYTQTILEIRNTRPPKPWSKIRDASIVYVPEVIGKQAGATIGAIWGSMFYPYQLYVPLPEKDIKMFDTGVPNLVTVAVEQSSTIFERINTGIEQCKGDYVAVISTGFPMPDMWVERSIYALMNCGQEGVAYEIENSTELVWGFVAEKQTLVNARRTFGNVSVRESLISSGVQIRQVTEEELPFKLDLHLTAAKSSESRGEWLAAGQTYDYMRQHYTNDVWLSSAAANAYYMGGDYEAARGLCEKLNQSRPTVDTLLLQAKVAKKACDFCGAIKLLKEAEDILEGKQLQWT